MIDALAAEACNVEHVKAAKASEKTMESGSTLASMMGMMVAILESGIILRIHFRSFCAGDCLRGFYGKGLYCLSLSAAWYWIHQHLPPVGGVDCIQDLEP